VVGEEEMEAIEGFERATGEGFVVAVVCEHRYLCDGLQGGG
jgi:hypothetical protein